jgi:hypothetical protein
MSAPREADFLSWLPFAPGYRHSAIEARRGARLAPDAINHYEGFPRLPTGLYGALAAMYFMPYA